MSDSPAPKSARFIFDVLGRRYSLPLLEECGGTKERIIMTATILFAQSGYAAVSIRDIAGAVGIRPSSLYNHFPGKEDIWIAALDHIKKLYLLYFERLDQTLGQAGSYDEMIATLFYEPKRLANIFTCYGFSLVMMEQIHNDLAAETFNLFQRHGLEVIKARFDACVALKMTPPFDTQTTALVLLNSIFMGLAAKVQQRQGRRTAYEPETMFADLERFLLRAVGGAGQAPAASDPSGRIQVGEGSAPAPAGQRRGRPGLPRPFAVQPGFRGLGESAHSRVSLPGGGRRPRSARVCLAEEHPADFPTFLFGPFYRPNFPSKRAVGRKTRTER